MCFTQGMSVCLAALAFGMAAHEYRAFKNWQYSIGIAYWGLMEVLQTIQHSYAAGPEDGYAMCHNQVNKYLAKISNTHLVFQPAVMSLLLMSMYRRHDITARIVGDFLFRLCLITMPWWSFYAWTSAAMGVDQELLPPSTKECPNYQWLYEGYDGFLGETTPNVPGQPCVYYAPTNTGHLAWAVPIFKQTYFWPSPNVHFLLFFGPYIIMFNRPLLQASAIVFWLTGPILMKYLTPSVNEQPAIWCFYSVVQVTLYAIVVRWQKLHQEPIPLKIHHPGTYGEKPLTYVLQRKDSDVVDNNSHVKESLSLLQKDHEGGYEMEMGSAAKQ